MDWKRIYNERLTSAEKAVAKIKSGDRVLIGHASGEPSYLVDVMVENRERYENVELVHMVPMGKCDYVKPGMEKHFVNNAVFLGANNKEAINSGRGYFTPSFLHEFPKWFKTTLVPDVALVQVSPPDKHGFVSFGISVDYTLPAARCAKLTIAEVNPNMPRTFGDAILHVSEIDCFVETDHPLIELGKTEITEVEQAIGRNCASLIEDGSTLQLGIGAIPDAVLGCLTDKRDLGIHTEMLSDSVVKLYEKGVITNRAKTIHPGKFVATFVMGSRALYDFVDDNPCVELYPCDYVNDPFVIAQNRKMVSINSCVQVDLTGQVAAEAVGPRQISGVGGQVDFIRGALRSEGGKSIIAFASSSKGTYSKIVPELAEGSIVTSLRNDVDYIVTEYGIANMKGKKLNDRARELIGIAHPDFRPELISFYETRFKEKF